MACRSLLVPCVVMSAVLCLGEGAGRGAIAIAIASARSQLEEARVARDIERVIALRDALRLEALDIETLQRALASADVREDRDIGFGARRMVLAVYAGYTTTWIHVLATTPDARGVSRIAALRCQQVGPAATWVAIEPRLRAAWQRELVAIEHGLQVDQRDHLLDTELQRRAQAALGAVPPVAPPAELARAFERLVSPFADLVLGVQYGDDGAPPPGRLEVEALVAAQRYDLVRRVLRGMNPEGRAWASHALLARQKQGGGLDPADALAIDVLRQLPLELTCSEGCVVSARDFGAALAIIDGQK